MDVAKLQGALTAAGYPCAADGQLGAATYGALLSFASGRALWALGEALGVGMVRGFAAFGVDSDLQRLHWIAQATHETEGFRFLIEQGDAAYFARYDQRPNLGNTQPGDGYRYRGRGLFQITGRWNYRHYEIAVAQPLEDSPDLAADPANAARIACAFWKDRAIGPLADADDIEAVTRKINGGLNGLADRAAILGRLKSLSPL